MKLGPGKLPPMPPNPAPHIFDRLIEIGIVTPTGMGQTPISWQEIAAWSQMTGVKLEPWEARLIRSLSVKYVAESRAAENETYPAPWRGPVTQQEMDAEVQGLRGLLG